MRLSHNIFSQNVYSNYNKALSKNSSALSKISSGIKIQMAKDNSAKITQNEILKIRILSNSAAKKNIQDTSSMLQTFDGAMQQINDSLTRMKELAVNAANGVSQDEDKQKIQTEIDEIINNIDYIAKNTQFNDTKLINSSSEEIKSQIGALENEVVHIPKADLTVKKMFPNGVNLIESDELREKALTDIDDAIDKVTRTRALYGAIQSNINGAYDSLSSINQSLENAQSNIGDADIAEEMLSYAQSDIFVQSSIALMAQSNNIPQDALRILENVGK